MDVSSKSFVVHAINGRKKKIFSGEVSPTRVGLRTLVRDLGSANKLIVFEAGNQMKWISLYLKKIKGVCVHVVHPNEVKWISQSNGKTDKVDDGIWKVTFMDYDIGCFDEDSYKLAPLDNPLEKVLPMSSI